MGDARTEASSLNPDSHIKASRSSSHFCDTTGCELPVNYRLQRALGNGETIGKWCVGHFIEWIRIMTHDPLVDGVYSMARAVLDADAEVA